ncbi:hypothetical protein GCM10023328_47220 [Modestobacter marinus]|uniref:Antitoxin Xre/MbcA/ParS-like toxin-binding domain-containing protein n=1 Tax=Modestobacter marinus TaxID=477641 RepID=A0ABQ2GAR0_9ACTN|nr:hypothetical protein GCM10011589_45420 [Modestobacter marinus]
MVHAHPELADAGTSAPLVLAISARDATEAAALSDVMTAAKAALRSSGATLTKVMDALFPAERDFPMPPALLEQVNRNAKARAELADEFGLLSGAEVAELAASTSGNASAMASRWKNEGKVFTVGPTGGQRFPGFQFGKDDGRPLPVIAQVLTVFGDRLSGWELALWFTSSNGWLGGERPVDVLDSDPELVVDAAGHLAAELLG